jgi:glucose/arabinose dehydrogenase
MFARIAAAYIALPVTIFVTSICSFSSYGQVYPPGFSQVLVATIIQSPTAVAFAPDGRIFVTQQGGLVRVIKNNALLATSFVSVTVDQTGERGLIGIALDPDFSTNNYVYLYYTVPGTPAHNRVSRFTANGDVAVAGSETILLEIDPLSTSTIHNGGAMHFGNDGKLYIAVGENANPTAAQNLDTHLGKLLRINKDGSVPAGNPFPTGSEQRKRVWAYGLRNPFTFDIDPLTGRIFVNDVGQAGWEEINDATVAGRNFGWPTTEGTFNPATYPNFTNPVYAYAHNTSGDGVGCAITGGTFFNPTTTNYPAAYVGRYFFRDFCNDWINTLDLSGASPVRNSFATSIPGNGITIATGNDGNLYFLSREVRSLFKIVYTNSTAPFITTQPANVSVNAGQPATFQVAASGSAPLSYQWQKNGTNIPGAINPTFTINNTVVGDNGMYRVVVSNGSGSVMSNQVTLTVVVNTPPVAEIITPETGTTYVAGATISFSGSGTDDEDGPLPPAALSWGIDFHHDTHKHDEPPINGVSGGSFVIPTVGETSDNVWYRIKLTVTDSKGSTAVDSVDIYPRKSTLNFTTIPAGLQITLDGQPLQTPASVVSVEGVIRSIGIISPQIMSNAIYVFNSWSNGGAAVQSFSTPTDDVTFTAQFSISDVKLLPLITWATPAPITAGTALSSTQLNASAGYNGNPLPGTFTYTPPGGTVLGEGNGRQLRAKFFPTNSTLYDTISKVVTIDVLPAPTQVFYRAINLNGPAYNIDGNSWAASTGAPNFSYTTNRSVFSNQNVTLIPPTDANRAAMIRSSVWGNNVNLAVSAVPPGNYQVWLYVWEDNSPAIFSVSVEGAVVLSDYNSGPGGTWKKLGPYPVNLTDGTINVSTSGGHGNLSGIEIWSGQPASNQAPVVSNPIPNQSAIAGTMFSYTFPSNTFSDPDPGTTLSYAASLTGGGVLPAWLSFSPATRNFAGTPLVANVGNLALRVTASDGSGGMVNDDFVLTVNPAPAKIVPLITWSNPVAITAGTALGSAQLNAAATHNSSPVPGSFTYTPPSGTVLGEGTAQLLRAKFFPTNATTYDTISKTVTINVLPPSASAFYRAINLNGSALNIDGNSWAASAGAPNFSYTTNRGVFSNQNVTLIPGTDANRATMIRSSVWGNTVNLVVSAVPADSYQVWLYTWEDNNPAIFSVSVEGSQVVSDYNSGSAGMWKKHGPYDVAISDGTINVSTSGGHGNISGIEIWTTGSTSARTSAASAIADADEKEYSVGTALLVYPNPFSGRLNVEFTPDESAPTELTIYDIRGVQVRVLFKGNSQAGVREHLEVDTGSVPDGIYVLELVNGKSTRYIRLAATH